MTPVSDPRAPPAEPRPASLTPEELEHAYNELGDLMASMEMEACRTRNELLHSEEGKRLHLQHHIEKLENHVRELEKYCETLKAAHEENRAVLERELFRMQKSISWRITRPLRALRPIFSRFCS